MTNDLPSSGVARSLPAQATEDDVYYAYRLLLGREPDEAGWTHFVAAARSRTMTPEQLSHALLSSVEFANRNGTAASQTDGLIEVQLEDYSLFVRSDDRDIGGHIEKHRNYEAHVTAALRGLLKRGQTFVDVGANVGFFTNLAASLVGPSGHVVSVEALDKNAQLIHRSLERNGFEHVVVHVCAAADRAGRLGVITDPGTSNGQAIDPGSDTAKNYVQALTLDTLTRDLDRIDVVKLDIEGFEQLAWNGFKASLERHRPTVITEFHPYCMTQFAGIDPETYLRTLFDYGNSLDVLSIEGTTISCSTPGDVLEFWRDADSKAGTNGLIHLDLLVRT